MSERSSHELGGVLAGPPPRARRLRLTAAALAIALAAAGVVIAIWPTAFPRELLATLSGPVGQDYFAAFSPDGKTLAVVNDGGNDGGISLWDVATRRWKAKLPGGRCQFSGPVVYSPDGKTLAEFTVAHTTCLWNLATGQETTLTDPCPPSSGFGFGMDGAFSPDGATLAVADCTTGSRGHIYLWDLATRHLTATLPGPDYITSVVFGPDGMLAGGRDDAGTLPAGEIYLWDLPSRHLTATLTNPGQDSAASLDFGPGGMLAVGDGVSDGNVYLWNVTTRKLTATIHLPFSIGRAQAVASNAATGKDDTPGPVSVRTIAAFSPDGKILAANAQYGHGTSLYDVATRKLLATLTDPGTDSSRVAREVVFSPHGSMLAVVDGNGRTYLWHVG
jgi:WD40 repeat protein